MPRSAGSPAHAIRASCSSRFGCRFERVWVIKTQSGSTLRGEMVVDRRAAAMLKTRVTACNSLLMILLLAVGVGRRRRTTKQEQTRVAIGLDFWNYIFGTIWR